MSRRRQREKGGGHRRILHQCPVASTCELCVRVRRYLRLRRSCRMSLRACVSPGVSVACVLSCVRAQTLCFAACGQPLGLVRLPTLVQTCDTCLGG
eukprot:8563970-Alexandrium_andersonii.AAC.1